MSATSRSPLLGLALALSVAVPALATGLLASPAQAEPTRAEIARSVHLREDWQYLTRGIAWPASWTPDSAAFSYRRTVEGGFAFETVTLEDLTRAPSFDHARLAEGLGRLLGNQIAPLYLPFSEFSFTDAARQTIRFYIDYTPYECGLADYTCRKIAYPGRPRGFGVVRDLSVPADNTPRVSPDGAFEALVEDSNLLVRSAQGGEVRLRTATGTEGDFYDPETIAWSPDSRHLMIYRVRPGFARQVLRVEAAPAGQLQPGLQTQLYPKPGDAIDQEQPVLVDVATGTVTEIDPALFPDPYELSAPRWRRDGQSAEFDYMQRGFQEAKVIAVDAATGRAHAAVRETADTFVFGEKRFVHDVDGLGKELIWTSERDGNRHIYLVDGKSGKLARQITKGDWVVREVVRVDDAARRIWFAASGMNPGEDPYFVHYYRVDFDGRHLVALSPETANHQARFAPDMRHFVDTYSRVDAPEVTVLRRAEDGAKVAEIARGDITRLTAAGFHAPEVFTAKGRDGTTDIWGLVVRPRDYDPAKSYPVIENIYAGPHDSFVPKNFWPFGYHSGGDKVIGMQALADLGFILVQIDGMGTANRSKSFHDVAWKNLADSGFPDRIAWHRALAARDPSYDISRVGIYGASAGGQSTLNALLFHGDFYKAGFALAGCYDNRMDKISWNEQWLGWPVDASYLAASGVEHADKLRGRLFMVVGEQDSNVDPASTMQVVDALIKADKDFDLLVVPGGEHSTGRSSGPIDYVTRRQFDFFVDALQTHGAEAAAL
ncbi:DPP IV N-terminal domain-containing protein [Novosphingobium sp. BW1]|uniref:DPP IV N-terminal domain-containing protein n=1 Tax=Novosphingobium sp. BW1 TaxID=2592621 RepID=UPI0011DE9A00|nr:DPP IV N-terminal domain-containing protein [Novosphingobium sp. BW1]TYC92067.1 prolyl oligopeptidase family serine peptidase [Novosphingobium sp. BW1]